MGYPTFLSVLSAALFIVSSGLAIGADKAPALVKVASGGFDRLDVVPGTDFRQYFEVWLEPATVRFRGDWLKEMNANRIALMQGTSARDADELAREVAEGLDAAMARALRHAGYEVAHDPAPGVIRLAPRIVDLYVNAPRSVTTALPGRVYTTSAGQATFDLDLRDAASGRLLGHAIARRTIGDRGDLGGSLRSTSPVSNAFDFQGVFDEWSRATVRALDDMRNMQLLSSP